MFETRHQPRKADSSETDVGFPKVQSIKPPEFS